MFSEKSFVANADIILSENKMTEIFVTLKYCQFLRRLKIFFQVNELFFYFYDFYCENEIAMWYNFLIAVQLKINCSSIITVN